MFSESETDFTRNKNHITFFGHEKFVFF